MRSGAGQNRCNPNGLHYTFTVCANGERLDLYARFLRFFRLE
jgi:hypothetical protein